MRQCSKITRMKCHSFMTFLQISKLPSLAGLSVTEQSPNINKMKHENHKISVTCNDHRFNIISIVKKSKLWSFPLYLYITIESMTQKKDCKDCHATEK